MQRNSNECFTGNMRTISGPNTGFEFGRRYECSVFSEGHERKVSDPRYAAGDLGHTVSTTSGRL